jgi:hypothetical protein
MSKGPESAQGVGLVILFPLAIVSNGLVPTQHMPAVLRVIADWNPVSAVTAAARQLWGNLNPSATIHAWPMQHPVAASLLWSVALLVIFAPPRHPPLPPAHHRLSATHRSHLPDHRPQARMHANLSQVGSLSAADAKRELRS